MAERVVEGEILGRQSSPLNRAPAARLWSLPATEVETAVKGNARSAIAAYLSCADPTSIPSAGIDYYV
jgi:hypothetical protein